MACKIGAHRLPAFAAVVTIALRASVPGPHPQFLAGLFQRP
jgi:hypothetical protein